MSRLRVNRISPRTGSTVTIDGWSNQATSRAIFASEHGVARDEDVTEPLQDLLTEAVDGLLASNGQAGSRKIIELPHGDMFISKPVLLRKNGNVSLTLRGAGPYLSQLTATSGWYGPMLVTLPESGGVGYDDVETGASLYAGGPSALRFRSDDDAYFLLSDAKTLRLDGLSAFTFEFRTKVTASGSRYIWMAAQSKRGLNGENTDNFRILWDTVTSGTFFNIRIGGVLEGVRLLAGEPVVDQVYDFAVDYDGTTLRAYVDGTLVPGDGSTAASGTVTQELVEDLTLGAQTAGVFEGSIEDPAFEGYIQNIRISDIARYEGTDYDPVEGVHAWDDDTLFLWTGADACEGPFAVARTTGNAKFWMILHRQQFGGGVIQSIAFEDFAMHGQQNCQWVENISTTYGVFRNMLLQFPGAVGWRAFNNSFLCTKRDLLLSGMSHTQAVLEQTFVSGFGQQDNVTVQGGIYLHAFGHSSGDSLYNNYYVPSSDSAVGMYVADALGGDGNNHHWEKTTVGQENIGADWESPLVAVNAGNMMLTACELEGQDQPSMKLKGVRAFTMIGGRLNSGQGSYAIDINERGEQPVRLIGVKQRTNTGPVVPWTDTGFEDAVIVEEYGQNTQGPATLTDLDTTPVVAGNGYWLASNSVATTITDFDGVSNGVNPPDGWVITIEFTNGNTTIQDGASIQLNGGANFVGSADDMLTLRSRGGVWREVSRSVN